MDEFAQFWAVYPRKVGRLAAEREFARARRRATLDELLTGVDLYIQHKPAWQDYCHPRTWLHQGRWMDEYEPAQQAGGLPVYPPHVCPHTPTCWDGRFRCHQRTVLAQARKAAS